jgi:hypothetical protein
MYDVGVVRSLCHEVAIAQDEKQTETLLDLLQAIVLENQEEIALRLAFLKEKYPFVFDPLLSDSRMYSRIH